MEAHLPDCTTILNYKKFKVISVQFQELRTSEPDRFCLNVFSQIGDEERILTTSSLKSILFNKYEVCHTNYSNMYKTENKLP